MFTYDPSIQHILAAYVDTLRIGRQMNKVLVLENDKCIHIEKPFQEKEIKASREKVLYKKEREITERIQAEKALRASRESFHNIVERSADGMIVVDREGVLPTRLLNPCLAVRQKTSWVKCLA
jgi:PAS domain-containing protein